MPPYSFNILMVHPQCLCIMKQRNMAELSLVSLNCNGLNDPMKRSNIFQLLKLSNVDIVFLQETHCCSMTFAKRWEAEWGGKCFWSFGSNRSKGVAILFASHLVYSINQFQFDTDGRLISMNIVIGGNKFNLINIYAPVDSVERRKFLRSISHYINKSSDSRVFLGGDFNFVENLTLDMQVVTL